MRNRPEERGRRSLKKTIKRKEERRVPKVPMRSARVGELALDEFGAATARTVMEEAAGRLLLSMRDGRARMAIKGVQRWEEKSALLVEKSRDCMGSRIILQRRDERSQKPACR